MEKYIIGLVSEIQSLFPEIDLDHSRKSLDGTLVVIEKDLDELTTSLLEDSGAKVLDHSQVLEFLNSPKSVGVWYQKMEVPKYVPPVIVPEVPVVPEVPPVVEVPEIPVSENELPPEEPIN